MCARTREKRERVSSPSAEAAVAGVAKVCSCCSTLSPPGGLALGPCQISGSHEPLRHSVPKTSPLRKEPYPTSVIEPHALKDTEEISDQGQAPAATCYTLAPQALHRFVFSHLFCDFLGSFPPLIANPGRHICWVQIQ